MCDPADVHQCRVQASPGVRVLSQASRKLGAQVVAIEHLGFS